MQTESHKDIAWMRDLTVSLEVIRIDVVLKKYLTSSSSHDQLC